MSWFKVDDGFWSHPKTLMLRPEAIALWVRTGAWSCQQLTDGFIPDHALPMFAPTPGTAEELVNVGLWVRDDDRGGYHFHDWSIYQEESVKVKARREKARIRMKEAREKAKESDEPTSERSSQSVRANKTRTFADDSKEVRSTPTRPDPTRPSSSDEEENPPHSPSSQTVTRGFDEFWAIYPRKSDKGHARTAWAKAVRKADVNEIIQGAQRFKDDPNLGEKQFIPHPTTWLNGERWADGPLPERTSGRPLDPRGDALKAAMERARALDAAATPPHLEIGA